MQDQRKSNHQLRLYIPCEFVKKYETDQVAFMVKD